MSRFGDAAECDHVPIGTTLVSCVRVADGWDLHSVIGSNRRGVTQLDEQMFESYERLIRGGADRLPRFSLSAGESHRSTGAPRNTTDERECKYFMYGSTSSGKFKRSSSLDGCQQ